jgi:hypothetical protein
MSACGGNKEVRYEGAPALVALADEPSLARLEMVEAGQSVLLSLRGDGPFQPSELRNAGARSLGHTGNIALVAVAREDFASLANIKGLNEVVIWGDAGVVARLDPVLRQSIVSAMSDPEWRGRTISVIATFDKTTPDPGAELREMGVEPRSVGGGVATLDASVETLFELLQLPDLIELSEPTMQRPLGGL